ncbi:NLP/P60-like protein [Pseudomonas syringae pv. cerasicola]|uniref:NLP/P60-like protein n=1 Tax=Pseudomonas syringae pv. cerasicola TaxID=264451 RepID=A0A0P9SHN5_PSESX|nr:NLP/P60-like protein [Pseudomonas syringae pv. cerasicola]
MDQPQRGDMVVMEVGWTKPPNHTGIYLGTDASLPKEESQVFGPVPVRQTQRDNRL